MSVLACGFDPEARLEEIRRQQELGEFAATVGSLRELLEATPDDPELNHLYGVTLLGVQQPELAIWAQLAALEAEQGDRALGASVRLRPDSPSTQYWLSQALAATEDEEGARRTLEASLAQGAFPKREAAQAEFLRLNGD